MDKRIQIIVTGLCALFVFSVAFAQPAATARVERWNDMWMTVTNYGGFSGCELPGGSGQQYMDFAALWIGAIIIESGNVQTPRVSVATDGWLSPSINELWPPDNGTIVERSRRDTVNEFGQPIYSPQAIADHEFECTFTDTLTSTTYVRDDPIDGPHHPLGIKVTQTTYAMLSPECRHILWVKYHLQNIGSNYLQNPCLGFLIEGGVAARTETDGWTDDIRGYAESEQVAYMADNDGRPANVHEGNDFTVPNVLGMCALEPAVYNDKWPSFNWWVSNGDTTYDFGPSWQTASAWTATYGTPTGDANKYDLLMNGEHDFDEVYTANGSWIQEHPQQLPNSTAMNWRMPDTPQEWDIANGYYTRLLYSLRGVGIRDYQDQTGRWVYRLNPGEVCDVWLAYVGGMNFHNAAHPQPTDTVIDPSLFDFTDLIAHVQTARAGMCLNWADVSGHLPHVMPVAFMLDPVYPNPFNAQARVRFSLQREAHVDIMAYDILGREAARIVSGSFAAGSHEMIWDAHELPSGLYFVQARTEGSHGIMQKVILLK